jgi:hypothetical protein
MGVAESGLSVPALLHGFAPLINRDDRQPERTFDNKRIWFADEVKAKNFRQWGQQPSGTGA